jgi:hypothetical protein
MTRPYSHTYEAIGFVVDRVVECLVHSAGTGVSMYVLVFLITLFRQSLGLHNHPLGNFILDACRIVYASP